MRHQALLIPWIGLLVGCKSDLVIGNTNALPVATIGIPSDGDMVTAQAPTRFHGNVSDPDDEAEELTVQWKLDGVVVCGNAVPDPDGDTACDLDVPEGEHSVALVVHDPSNASDTASISVTAVPDAPPLATIFDPVEEGVYYRDHSVALAGTVSDIETPTSQLEAWWEIDGALSISSIDTPDGDGGFTGFAELPEGEHHVYLFVRDAANNTDSDVVTVRVGPPNTAPSCAILAPESGAVVRGGLDVLFEGTATDPDVPNEWLIATWASEKHGVLGTSVPTTSEGLVTLSTPTLSMATHTISLTVEDEVGATASCTTVLTVGGAPTLTLVHPGDGETFPLGDTILFEATVTDSEDPPEALELEWSSSLSGVFDTEPPDGNGVASFGYGGLAVGDHLIEVVATDTTGLTSTATASIEVVTACGDGVVTGAEVCDDGNLDDSDACTSACVPAFCGDGYLWAGEEQCDDGNTIGGDGCSEDCIAESCGDGVVQGGEECDDGNGSNDDACLNTCDSATCGDGYIRLGVEACDDGNLVSGDGCSSTCTSESCGDGIVQVGESCDDGNQVDTDGCTSACQTARCGDGYTWSGVEQCDDANASDTDGCLSTCVSATCGDGHTWVGVEQCDDGNGSNTDGCLGTCVSATCGDSHTWVRVEQCDDGNGSNSDACLATCESASCGDGYTWSGVEQCDDGNTWSGDGCSSSCATEGCGDGIVQAGEACDDGNASNTDGCTSACETARCGDGYTWSGVEQCDDGNASNTDACLTSCDNATCGDGYVRSGVEQCDDGNASNTDGCLASCTTASCGDGYTWSGVEQCDDGNGSNTDSCLSSCVSATCGDGYTWSGVEACDPGAWFGGTCDDEGYDDGSLTCGSWCAIDESDCCTYEIDYTIPSVGSWTSDYTADLTGDCATDDDLRAIYRGRIASLDREGNTATLEFQKVSALGCGPSVAVRYWIGVAHDPVCEDVGSTIDSTSSL